MVGGVGGVHGEADRGELGELGQVVEDGVEDHRHQEVAARVLLSVITASSINIRRFWLICRVEHCAVNAEVSSKGHFK